MCMRRKGAACETAHCMVPGRPAGGRDGEAFNAAPEGAGGVVARQAGVGMDVAGDVNGVRRSAPRPSDLRVETDGDVDFVVAGQEQEGKARRAEFTVLLDGVDLVDLMLDGGGGHGGTEDEDVGAEVGGLRCSAERCGRQRKQQSKREGLEVRGRPLLVRSHRGYFTLRTQNVSTGR